MNKKIVTLIFCLISQASLAVEHSINPPNLENLPPVVSHGLPQLTPNVNIENVVDVFGHDLSRLPTPVANFLLAVGFEKTKAGSQTFDEPVGVPYIAYTGVNYWLDGLINGNADFATQLNTVLILLLNQKDVVSLKNNIHILINEALTNLDSIGYWPASYLLAERMFVKAETESDVSMPELITAMNRMASCADANFAPCQMRVGLQLHANPEAKNISSRVLEMSLKTYYADERYTGHDTEILLTVHDVLDANDPDYQIEK